jgi:hypothetical protein
MHGTEQDEPSARRLDKQKQGPARDFRRPAFAEAQALFEQIGERICGKIGGANEALGAGFEIGYENGGPARGALAIQRGKQLTPHQSILSM